MSDPIQTLMTEHRLIERVLDSLTEFSAAIEAGTTDDRESMAGYVRFFRTFADRRHHGKEEDLLFESMCSHGFSREFGPLMVMLGEHNVGRARVGEMATVAEGTGPLTDPERAGFRSAATAFIELLRNHIAREDGILFPAALQALPGDEIERLGREFDSFESDATGAGVHDEMHALAERLIAAHPPAAPSGSEAHDPARV